ncbi:dipeptidase [Virgibacillus sp. YIM 98842]|uniref:dipeptidase n=1 Tax=Virgibacillus sp. YIM 98842 TaxID=2663533 RepID=UPI0013DCA470|nr:dipeptidase [Virgibacillus sp. YIM 98842]
MKLSVLYGIIMLALTMKTPLITMMDMKQWSPAEVYENMIIVDSHIDTLMKVVDDDTGMPAVDIGGETDFEVDIPKLKDGGLHVPFMAAFTSGHHDNHAKNISDTLASIHALYWTKKNNRETFSVTSTLDDIWRAIQDGKVAAVPAIEGAYSLAGAHAAELLHQYHDLGITTIGFTWNYSNELGEGANRVYNDGMNTPSSGGLTDLGETIVKEMNRLGMVIDVSHMDERTFWDVLDVSKKPVIATHSGVNALHSHPRNLNDKQLQSLAENGGAIGIVFYPEFLTDSGKAAVSDIVDHIDHAVEVMGADHVAIGSDFDGAALPADMQNAADLPKIAAELKSRGYSHIDIMKIMGGNTLRLLHEVQTGANPDSISEASGIKIYPKMEMGDAVESKTPMLRAEIELADGTAINENGLRVIIDGKIYEPDYDEDSSIMAFQPEEGLKEKFHVVTFEAASESGEKKRETRIFHIEE